MPSLPGARVPTSYGCPVRLAMRLASQGDDRDLALALKTCSLASSRLAVPSA